MQCPKRGTPPSVPQWQPNRGVGAMFAARNAGTVAVHLVDRGLVAAEVATGSSLLTSQVLFGEFLALTHINRDCSVTGHGTEVRTWPATERDLRATRAGTGTREGCHGCWMRPMTHPESPEYLRRYAPVAAHLQVSVAVDEFFNDRAALRAGRPGYTLGLPRLLTLRLEELAPVDIQVFGDVAALLRQQQDRLAAWNSRLRVQMRSKRLRRNESSESRAWVRIRALDIHPANVGAAEGLLVAIGAADHLELIDGGPEGPQLLAHVPSHLVAESLVPTGGNRTVITLTSSVETFDVAVIKAALALDPEKHPIDPGLLASVRATLDQVM